MKLTIEVPDEKALELIKLLEEMPGVKLEREKPQLVQEFEEALREVKLARKGEIELKSLKEVLDELRD
jgi:hypothetical protein